MALIGSLLPDQRWTFDSPDANFYGLTGQKINYSVDPMQWYNDTAKSLGFADYKAYQDAVAQMEATRHPEDQVQNPWGSAFTNGPDGGNGQYVNIAGNNFKIDGINADGSYRMYSGDSGDHGTQFYYDVAPDGTITRSSRTEAVNNRLDALRGVGYVAAVLGGGYAANAALGGGAAGAGGATTAGTGTAGAGTIAPAGWVSAEGGAGYLGGMAADSAALGGSSGLLGTVGSALNSPGGRAAGSIAGSLLAGGGGGGTIAPVTDTTQSDANQIQANNDAINNLFGGRDAAFYQSNVYQPSYDLQKAKLDDQRAITQRQLKFGLANRGMTGGSYDVDSHAMEGRAYTDALTDAAREAQAQSDQARSSDESTRLNLLGQLRSGVDQTSATNAAQTALQTNISQAKNNTSLNSVNNYLGTIAPTLNQFNANAADQRGRTAGRTMYPSYGIAAPYYGTTSPSR